VLSKNWVTVQWTTRTLRTIKSKYLREISIDLFILPYPVDHREWRELDDLLVELWISCSVRPEVMYLQVEGDHGSLEATVELLPGLVGMGAVYHRMSL
jgi:hypothetical protein